MFLKKLIFCCLAGVFNAQIAYADHHCPPFAWHNIIAYGPQTAEDVKGGKLPDGRVLALLKFTGEGGNWPKKSAVVLVKDGCYLEMLVVARHGKLKSTDDTPLYHIDYYQGDTQRLFTAQADEPSLDQVWEWGLSLMARPPKE